MSDAPLLKLGSARGSSQQEQQQASNNDALQPRDQSLLEQSAEAAQQHHPLHRRQPSPDNCNKAACGSGLKVLLSSLPDDIYVTTVANLVATHSAAVASTARCSAFRLPMAVLALLFTVALQLALVGLLWQAATTGDEPMKRPEDYRLWMQLGHSYQKICEVSDRVQEVDATVEDLKHQLGNNRSQKGVNTTTQCVHSMLKSLDIMVTPELLPIETISNCLRMSPDDMDKNMTCRKMLLFALSGALEFGWGMHHGTRYGDPDYVPDIHEGYHKVGMEYDATWFIIVAFIALVIAVHDEVRRALRLCTVAATLTLILPEFFGRDSYLVPAEKKLPKLHGTLVLVTPLLQLLVALAVLLTGGVLFLFDVTTDDRIAIITNSVALCFVLELDNKVGAIMRAQMLWHGSEAQPDIGRKILQHYVDAAPSAAAANGGSGRLSSESIAEAQWKRQWEQQSSASPTADPSDNADKHQQQQQLQQQCCSYPQLLGLAYFAVVGMLVFCEALLLAPQCNLQVLAVFAICRHHNGTVPSSKVYNEQFGLDDNFKANLIDKFFSDPTISPYNWFSKNVWFYFASGGFTQVNNFLSSNENIHELTEAASIGMCAAYICIVAFLIFLLFRDLLPCSQAMHRVHRWWPHALMIAQIIVAVIAVTQYDLHPEAVDTVNHQPWWYPAADPEKYVLATFFCCWGFVFVVWPLLFYYKWATTVLCKACNRAVSSCSWSASKLACWLHVGPGVATAAAAVGDGATSLV